MIEIKRYTQLDKNFLEEWKDLWEISREANYINSPAWFLSVITSFHKSNYSITALYRKKKLIAVAPLIEEKKYGISYKTMLPGDFVCGTPFLLIKKDKLLFHELIDSLHELGTIVWENIPDDLVKDIKDYEKQSSSAPSSLNYYSSFVKDSNGEIVIPNRAKLLHKVRRITNEFTLRSFDGTDKDALKQVFSIDTASRKQERGYNPFVDKNVRTFYRSLARYFKDHFAIHLLYFNNKAIAYEIGFKAKQSYFGSQISYKSEYKKYTPGKVLIVMMLEHIAHEGIEQIDFGSGDSAIKKMLAEDVRVLHRIVLSKHIILRTYLIFLSQAKKYIFELLESNRAVYTVYSRLKRCKKYGKI